MTEIRVRDLVPPILVRGLESAWSQVAASGSARRLRGQTRLHLGCGTNILDGWANLDLNDGPGVIRCDLTRRLPVASSSVDLIFSEHFVEHISHAQARVLIAECRRVLKPGGIIRISTPNLKALVREYSLGRVTEWTDVGWSPSSPCTLLNEGLRLWGHQYVYDAGELTALLADAGFQNIAAVEWRLSEHPLLCGLEQRPYHDDVLLEAVRPASEADGSSEQRR